jgi:hypothetical protein
MNDPLFKQSNSPITSEEEENITQSLAAAYRAHEETEKKPELQRIAKLIQKKMQQHSDGGPSDGTPLE